jgi:uncharacterized protein (DUF58 family)
VESLTSIEPRMLASLRGLKLRALRIVEGYVAGLHRSPYRGFSTEFAEHREYVPGDDLRYVDWKVYGRSDKVYLKQFADETNLICYLALDISESMTYRGPSSALSKLEYAQCLAAAIAWLVLKQQDAVALATFDSEIRSLARAAGAPSHLDPIVSAIESALPGKRTSAGPIFHELAQRWVKRGVVVVISDCLDDLASLVKGLHHFRHRPHDVILLHVLDAAELEFPFHEPTQFSGLENWPNVEADPPIIRATYLRELARFRQALEHECRRQQIDYFLLRTDEPLDRALTRVLTTRQRRLRG